MQHFDGEYKGECRIARGRRCIVLDIARGYKHRQIRVGRGVAIITYSTSLHRLLLPRRSCYSSACSNMATLDCALMCGYKAQMTGNTRKRHSFFVHVCSGFKSLIYTFQLRYALYPQLAARKSQVYSCVYRAPLTPIMDCPSCTTAFAMGLLNEVSSIVSRACLTDFGLPSTPLFYF